MIPIMSKQKKPAQAAPTPPRSPVITLRLGHGREARLTAWMTKQRVEPEKTATLIKALDEFLDREGMPPAAPESKG